LKSSRESEREEEDEANEAEIRVVVQVLEGEIEVSEIMKFKL
jgi:hypothetical protein